MPHRMMLVAALILGLLVAPATAHACENGLSSVIHDATGAAVSASCGGTVTQSPVADAVRKATTDSGTSTSTIPAPAEPQQRPVQKSCDDLIQNCPVIPEPTTAAAPPAPGAPPAITTAILREAATSLTLPPPDPQLGPDPTANPWGVVAVGYPLWLWTPGPDTVAAGVTAQGITVGLTARRTTTTFDMGDGTTLQCTTTTPYPGPTTPPTESPTCGYRYLRLPAQPGAGYTLRTTTHWTVTWTALGQTGSFPMTRAATRHLDVAEIQSLITAR